MTLRGRSRYLTAQSHTIFIPACPACLHHTVLLLTDLISWLRGAQASCKSSSSHFTHIKLHTSPQTYVFLLLSHTINLHKTHLHPHLGDFHHQHRQYPSSIKEQLHPIEASLHHPYHQDSTVCYPFNLDRFFLLFDSIARV